MSDTFIPVVQVECNTMPSRHEQGIPRFLSRGTQPVLHQQGIQMTMPPLLVANSTHPYPLALPALSAKQQGIPVPPSPRVTMATTSIPVNPQAFRNVDGRMIYGTRSPPSPSMSSTVSSVSVYEDCTSLPPTSPRQNHDTCMQPPGLALDRHFDAQPQQPAAGVRSMSMKSTSVTSIRSDCSSNTSSGQTPQIKPEQAMAMVNEKLRNRISNLEKKMQRAVAEVTFLGDRNWRLEAHLDCLMHTLDILGITDVEDLTGKTLPLPMFRVKVKAGYRLGPFNRLPRRAMWSYEESSKEPPRIDLSADRARTVPRNEGKPNEDDDDGLELPAGTDIGLSVRQMFHYERQIEELNQQNHALATKLEQNAARERQLGDRVKKGRGENADLLDELEETKAELNRVIQRLRSYESGMPAVMMPPQDDVSDHGSDSSSMSSSSYNGHPEYPTAAGHHPGVGVDYLRVSEASRAGPYFRRAPHRGPGRAGRDGRRHRDFRERDWRPPMHAHLN